VARLFFAYRLLVLPFISMACRPSPNFVIVEHIMEVVIRLAAQKGFPVGLVSTRGRDDRPVVRRPARWASNQGGDRGLSGSPVKGAGTDGPVSVPSASAPLAASGPPGSAHTALIGRRAPRLSWKCPRGFRFGTARLEPGERPRRTTLENRAIAGIGPGIQGQPSS